MAIANKSAQRGRSFTQGPTLALLLGFVHFAVDASSNFIMARLLTVAPTTELVALLVGYNLLAFATQPLVGFATDWLQAPRGIMASGLLLASAAMLLADQPVWLPLLLTGLGNALFHVGAGTLASIATVGKASGPGLFIGPGAIGVVVGAMMGRNLPSAYWPLTLSLLAFAPASVWWLSDPALPLSDVSSANVTADVPARARAILALLLLAISGRALLGARVGAQLVQHPNMAFHVAVMACTGKALGGLVADRIGWRRSAVLLLVMSSVLLVGGNRAMWAALAGVACFQAVTSITLAAIYRVLPNRIGLGFGLACLALFVGGLPALLHIDCGFFGRAPIDALLALLSALAIWRALSWLDGKVDTSARDTPSIAPALPSR